MKKTIALIVTFALGAFAGSGATYIYFKKQNEKMDSVKEKEKEEEFESVRKKYSELEEKLKKELDNGWAELLEEKKKLAELNKNKSPELMETYQKVLSGMDYASDAVKESVKEIVNDGKELIQNIKKDLRNDDIYLITSEELGLKEMDTGDSLEYNVEDLTYYQDGIVTDAMGEIIDNPDSLLGKTVMDLLPTYDSSGFNETYVRNDIKETDYRIDFAGCDFTE